MASSSSGLPKLNTEPFFLIHVIGRKIAILPTQRADQQRITFHIKDITMPASGNPNLSADTSRTTPYHLLLSLCRSTAFQSCQGYSGSVPYC